MDSADPDRSRKQAVALARRLDAYASERGWAGTDPYEGLNASRVIGPLRRSALGRRVAIQAVKRSPLDLRPLLGIRPEPNAAAVAWAVSAYARRGFLEPELERARLVAAVERLRDLRSPRFEELCFGYHFDFQSRVFFYPRGEPNAIASAFAGMALLDAHAALGDERLLDEAADVGRFFLRHIPQTEDGDGAYFGYLPDDRSPIHNSNMLACALLARLAAAGADRGERFADAAGAGLEWTLRRQRPDGSWPYGERPDIGWVDNFHTGYVLDSIRTCLDCGLGDAESEHTWRRGLDFFRRELVLADGTPKYYSTGVYPLDAQCVAQSIQTLAIAATHEPACADEAWRVLDFTLARMLRRDGLPLFQRRRLWVNRAPHMRWTVAPLLLAMTHLLATRADTRRREVG